MANDSYYQSVYTGSQIDNAIGRIVNGDIDNLSQATAESALIASLNASAAQNAYKGVQNALNNLPEGDTLIINDLTTGGTKAALSAEQGKILAQRPNPNLLDNWYFADPIDQRGGYVVSPGVPYRATMVSSATPAGTTTEYYKATLIDSSWCSIVVNGTTYYVIRANAGVVRGYVASGYTIDRWTVGERLVIEDGSITWTGNIIQSLENGSNLFGKTLTLSYLTDGGLITGTATLNESYEVWGATALGSGTLQYRANDVFAVLISARTKVIAAKLELGSVQTLAHQDADGNWVLNDPPPDKGMELIKCCMSKADLSDTYANSNRTVYNLSKLAIDISGKNITEIAYAGKWCLYRGANVVGAPSPSSDWHTFEVLPSYGDGVQGYAAVIATNLNNGNQYVTHTGNITVWKQLATTDYAVNKAGDTMTGTLKVSPATGNAVIQAINNDTKTIGQMYVNSARQTVIANNDVTDSTKFTRLILRGYDDSSAILSVMKGNNIHTILHTGNKPSGSYTGNGDATARTIDTGGIGGVVAIWNLSSAPRFAVIGPVGGVALGSSGAAVLYTSEVNFSGGKLTLKSASDIINASGVTYYYQVL